MNRWYQLLQRHDRVFRAKGDWKRRENICRRLHVAMIREVAKPKGDQ